MDWSTAHMDTLYADAISSEDRRDADHIGLLLDQETDEVVAPSVFNGG
jgi:hypothetical protein